MKNKQKQLHFKEIEDSKKQLPNTNTNDYKNELLISKEREILRIFLIKSLLK